jgi:DNA polymerase IV
LTRTILHLDMDAFFASVELLRRPDLRGRPVVVGGAGPRGVVAAASYEARTFGVHSAMAMSRARRACPDLVVVPPDHGHYAEVSARIMAVLRECTPLVEPLSLDEAFLDLTGTERLHGPAPAVAGRLRDRIRDQERLGCSVGVAPSKFLAKLASEAAKPRARPGGPADGPGVVVVEPGSELRFLHPLPVSRLWGVGPATLARLERLGVSTVGDLARLPVEAVRGAVGRAAGQHLHDLALGVDERPVVADAPPRSISHEETFPSDVADPEVLHRELVRMGDAVAARLRSAGLRGRTVHLKLRRPDFATITRSDTRPEATDRGTEITERAAVLLDRVGAVPGVRLLGVGVSNLTGGPAEHQLQLDLGVSDGAAPDRREEWDRANRAVDEVRSRFGSGSIHPARLVAEGTNGAENTRADR